MVRLVAGCSSVGACSLPVICHASIGLSGFGNAIFLDGSWLCVVESWSDVAVRFRLVCVFDTAGLLFAEELLDHLGSGQGKI